MANWNNPTLTSTYTNFVTEVKDRDVEAAVWFEGMSPTNLPTNAKRLNTSTGRFEKWNGTAWVDAVATFTFPALTVAGAATFNGNTTIGDAGADTLTVNAAATFAAAAAFNGNVTLGNAAGDTVTVNATLSFATAPVLTPGTANGVLFLNAGKVVSAGGALTFDGSNLGVGASAISGVKAYIASQSGNNTVRLDCGPGGFISDLTFGAFGFNAVAGVRFEDANSLLRLYANDARSIAFNVNNTEQMRLNLIGLGIGTTNPSTRLSLGGSIGQKLSVFDAGNIRSGFGVDMGGSSFELSIFSGYSGGHGIITFGGLDTATNTYTERVRIDTSGNLTANSSVTGHWQLPRGTTAQRTGSPASGMIRFNTTLSRYEGHNGSAWSSIGGGATGGGSDDVFYENGQTVTTNYTLTTNKNAMSAGPVTIASGITVTVPSGSNWAIV